MFFLSARGDMSLAGIPVPARLIGRKALFLYLDLECPITKWGQVLNDSHDLCPAGTLCQADHGTGFQSYKQESSFYPLPTFLKERNGGSKKPELWSTPDLFQQDVSSIQRSVAADGQNFTVIEDVIIIIFVRAFDRRVDELLRVEDIRIHLAAFEDQVRFHKYRGVDQRTLFRGDLGFCDLVPVPA